MLQCNKHGLHELLKFYVTKVTHCTVTFERQVLETSGPILCSTCSCRGGLNNGVPLYTPSENLARLIKYMYMIIKLTNYTYLSNLGSVWQKSETRWLQKSNWRCRLYPWRWLYKSTRRLCCLHSESSTPADHTTPGAWKSKRHNIQVIYIETFKKIALNQQQVFFYQENNFF